MSKLKITNSIMVKRGINIISEILIFLALGAILLIAISGGMVLKYGPLHLSIRHVQNPVLLLILALILRRLALGTCCRGFYSTALLQRDFRQLCVDDAGKPPFRWLPPYVFPIPRTFWLILLLSVVLNLWGISWGLPSFWGWITDEITPAAVHHAIEQHFSNGWFDKYPPFHYYLLALCYTPFYVLHHLHVIDIHSDHWYAVLFYVNRALSVLMGSAIVFIIYLCGCELYKKRAAQWAALIVALMPSFLYYAKNANLDVPYLFWFSLSLLSFLRLLQHHRTTDYLALAVTAMLAIGTKDQAYALYLLMPFSIAWSRYHYAQAHQRPVSLLAACFNRKTCLALVSASLLFILIHNWMFNWQGFVGHMKLITGPASQNFQMYEQTLTGHLRMFWQALKHLQFSFGWPIFLICAAGLVYAFVIPPRQPLLLATLIPGVSYYLFFISLVLYHYVRFMMPLCIVLALFGGKLIADVLKPNTRRYTLKCTVIVVVVVYSFWYAVSVDLLMTFDSRYTVEKWMQEHIDKDASIGLVELIQYLPRMTHFTNRRYVQASAHSLDASRPDYLVVNANIGLKRQYFYERLTSGEYNYDLVLRHRTPTPWALLDHTTIIKNGERVVFSSLDKINPEILIFKRTGIDAP